MTASRAGEKLGWLGGWAGGFLWVLALAILFLRGQLVDGLVGLVPFFDVVNVREAALLQRLAFAEECRPPCLSRFASAA
jgi:hypothetical protein